MNAPDLSGTRIDRYQVLRLLGSGGFGAVYRAKHVHTDAEVALKVLHRQLNADQGMIERFLREAKAAASVGNDHIVRVLDAGVAQDGTAFLAMELLDGWDLKELIMREGPQNPRRLVTIIAQVLDALAAAHTKGIVHRDMKPANVFVTKRDDGSDFVKLLDFGISKMHQAGEVSGLTMTGVAMGTPAYMAPEQFFDARAVDARADLYSVAAMLYELLGARLPLEAQSYAELIVKVKTEAPPPLASLQPKLPAGLAAAVDRGLAKDKEARWPSARDFAAALRANIGVTADSLPPRPADTGAPRSAPVTGSDASMMFGATSTPMPAPKPAPATPAPVVTGNTGWVVPQSNVTMPPPAPPPASAPVMQTTAPPPAKPGMSTGKIVAIVVASIFALLFFCCIAGNAVPQG
ncbi:MAG: serine/threonine protein kinase [Myxococcaceae bacterium]|nr:serine/threonine protein kinase [Myxococcaceae bacterium]